MNRSQLDEISLFLHSKRLGIRSLQLCHDNYADERSVLTSTPRELER